MKKKLLVAIVAVVLVACVSVTFALWLGNVEKDQTYTITMTDNFMYLSSDKFVLDSGDKLLPDQSVTHKFVLKVKGKSAVVKLECVEITFKPIGSDSYLPVAKDALAVTFDRNNIDVTHGNQQYLELECKSTLSFLLPVKDLDNKYENAQFRYKVKVSIAEKEVVNG